MLLKFKMVFSIIFISFLVSGCEENKFGDLFWPDEEDVICETDTTPVSFKNVGFWSEETLDASQDLDNDFKSINYKNLTTLNYAFINVNDKGEIVDFSSQDSHDRFEDLMTLAKKQNSRLKIGLSIGGGSDANFNSIAQSNSSLNTFAKNIAECLEGTGSGYSPCNGIKLDGIDLYWNLPDDKDEGKLFEKMVKTISEKIKPLGKYFSITVISGQNKDQGKAILDEVFQYVDYLNVMAFNPSESAGLASEMDDAKDAITYWVGRCVVKNKIVLGVPFYSGGDVKESFMEIVGRNSPSKERACKDSSSGKDYNGIPTMIEKTKYAKSNAGGVMMRYMQHDIFADPAYSLLDAIHKTSVGTAVTTCN